MAGRGQARDVDDVLDADRHAVQRPADPARRDLGLGRPRRRHRRLAVEADEGVEPGIEPLDAGEQRLHQLDRRKFLGGDRLGRRGGRHEVQVGHAPLLTGRLPRASAATVRRADRPAP